MGSEGFDRFIDTAIEAIKERRIELGINQKELGEMIGKAQSHVARFENGAVRDPRISMFFQICEALKVNPAEFFGPAFGDVKVDSQRELKDKKLRKAKVNEKIEMIEKLAKDQIKELTNLKKLM